MIGFMNRRQFAVSLFALALAFCLPAAAEQSSPAVHQDPCYWDTVAWGELTPAEQALWARLGWTAKIWDSSDANFYPNSVTKLFVQLSSDERDAAEKLGFNQETWDNVDDQDCAPDNG